MDWGTSIKRGAVSAALTTAVAAGSRTALAPFSPAYAATDFALKLSPGKAVFWPGVYIDEATVGDASACAPTTCPTYALTLAEPAARLRVAIDNPSRENTFTLELLDPAGTLVDSDATNNQFASEVFAPKPVAGTWNVRVVPTAVTGSSFRLRAKLERKVPALPAGKVAMLPNLKTVPPYEFGFVAPANPLNAVYPPDTVNPPLDVAGVRPLSCAADESAPIAAGGGGAVKCLRLTTGPINVGRGPFDMRFDFVSDTLSGEVDPVLQVGPARQAIHHSDGSVLERAAGTFSFHKTHAHFHTDQILYYEVFAVDDVRTGAIRPTGVGTKSGFCPADQLFGEWDKFEQLEPGQFGEGDSATGGNCFSPDGGKIGLSVGWGDVYRWQRPGQYVEFGGQPDGTYLVRTTADKFNHVLEENENDNTAYALINVVGETVTIVERGQGTDPWDSNKRIFTGNGPAAVELASAQAIYFDEVAPAPIPTVASVVLNAEELPRTGATPGPALVMLASVAVLLPVLRRSLLRAPQRSSVRRRR